MTSIFSNLGNKAFGSKGTGTNLITMGDPLGVHSAPFAPKPKADTPEPIATPKPEDAEEKARQAMLKKRRIQARAGGKTILASNYGGNVDTTTKTLLGE